MTANERPHPEDETVIGPEIEADIEQLVRDLDSTVNPELARELMFGAARLVADRPDRLDMKIASAALAEMREAFDMFRPYRDLKKVTIFGSARTRPDDPAYALARDVARRLAEDGWMVVTGAGPGIMMAANEGAGRERSFGVNIRLPFEQEANAFLAGDEKLVAMKYFFTRKLMLIKESKGFVALPGGFGTLDETFELLTLQQTGKAEPSPVVLLDVPGGTYWKHWEEFVTGELEAGGLINPADRRQYFMAHDVGQACREITRFWHNYHSIRYVGDRLVVRMLRPVPEHLLEEINAECGYLAVDGRILPSQPLRPEITSDDVVDLPRLAFRYGPRHYGRLRPLIDLINTV